jgi:uncharacterized Tic20 family protein
MAKVSEPHQAGTQDERIVAALGHASIVWPMMGIIAPAVIWATQREKSPFLAFQALQAAVYHMTLILAGLACGACYFCSYLGTAVGLIGVPTSMFFAFQPEGPAPEELPPMAVVPLIVGFLGVIVFNVLILALFLLGLAVWGAYVGYGLYGAVATLQGKDFRYVLLGSRLERYLEGTRAASKPTS